MKKTLKHKQSVTLKKKEEKKKGKKQKKKEGESGWKKMNRPFYDISLKRFSHRSFFLFLFDVRMTSCLFFLQKPFAF